MAAVSDSSDVQLALPADPTARHRGVYRRVVSVSWGYVGRQRARRFGFVCGDGVLEVEVFGRYVGVYR